MRPQRSRDSEIFKKIDSHIMRSRYYRFDTEAAHFMGSTSQLQNGISMFKTV